VASIQDSIGFNLWQLQHQVQLRLENEIAELRLTLPQAAILMWLDTAPGIRSVDLARELLLTPQAISLMINKLAEAGYLDRTAPNVGRSQPLTITAAGRTVLTKAQVLIDSVNQHMFAMFSADERTQLRHLLSRALTAARDSTDTEQHS
jgi:DNA-binding MarR family transcriptional regulator